MGEPLAVAALLVGAGYVVPALVLVRDRRWSAARTASGALGVGVAVVALVGPLADAAHHDVRAHMAAHLLLGMVAPLLLVLADPVTLALRALPVRGARRLVRGLRARPVRVLTHPATATVLDMGGLWVLYRTGLMDLAMTSPTVHLLVMAHVLGAGCLFTHAVIGHDPTPGRPGFATRATFLVLGLAAHAVLAKSLYATPAPGTGMTGGPEGAVLMYYGGDAVDVVLMVVLCAQWYAATAPGRVRRSAHPASRIGPTPAEPLSTGPASTALASTAPASVEQSGMCVPRTRITDASTPAGVSRAGDGPRRTPGARRRGR